MPFLPSFCIALSLSSFDEPPMVAGAAAASRAGASRRGRLAPAAFATP